MRYIFVDMELRSYVLGKASWPFALEVGTQYSLVMVPGTEVLGKHLLRAAQGRVKCKF